VNRRHLQFTEGKGPTFSLPSPVPEVVALPGSRRESCQPAYSCRHARGDGEDLAGDPVVALVLLAVDLAGDWIARWFLNHIVPIRDRTIRRVQSLPAVCRLTIDPTRSMPPSQSILKPLRPSRKDFSDNLKPASCGRGHRLTGFACQSACSRRYLLQCCPHSAEKGNEHNRVPKLRMPGGIVNATGCG
jgi:hypothetical protein